MPGASSGWRTTTIPGPTGEAAWTPASKNQPWAITAALGSWAPQGRYVLQSVGHELRDADTDKGPICCSSPLGLGSQLWS